MNQSFCPTGLFTFLNGRGCCGGSIGQTGAAMKKAGLSIIAFCVLFTGKLYAEDQSANQPAKPTQQHQYDARVVDPIFTPKEEYRVSPIDYPNGIYVVAQKGGLFSKPTRFDKVETILAEKLKQHGFNISESKEGADATISTSSSIDFSEIQENKNNAWARGLSIADDIIGVVGGAKLTGGQSLLVDGINVNLHKKRHWVVFRFLRSNGKEVTGGVNVGAQYSEDTPVVSAALFELMFDEWAKKHIEQKQDGNSRAVSSEPAVSTASAVAVTTNK